MDRALEIKRYYSEWWENPHDTRSLVYESLNRYVRQRLPDGRGRRALDLGSGRGRIIGYLLDKGYEVTGVEFNEGFVGDLRRRFPSARIIQADLRDLELQEAFDLVTCIEVAQVLPQADLCQLLERLSGMTRRIMINISNSRSLHGAWVRLRRFQRGFITSYQPHDLDQALQDAGFRIVHRRGIGLVTPITLLSDFRLTLIPAPVAAAINRLDALAPGICHLYYAEGVATKQPTGVSR